VYKKNSFGWFCLLWYFSFGIAIPGYNFEHATTFLGFRPAHTFAVG
jgi:hypothetical protein